MVAHPSGKLNVKALLPVRIDVFAEILDRDSLGNGIRTAAHCTSRRYQLREDKTITLLYCPINIVPIYENTVVKSVAVIIVGNNVIEVQNDV